MALEQQSKVESSNGINSTCQYSTKKSFASRVKSAPYHENFLSKVKNEVVFFQIETKTSFFIIQDVRIPPRNIHSSPAVFQMDYVVERFHDRSLALAQSREEIEELELPNQDESFDDEKFVVFSSFYRFTTLIRSFRKLVRQGTYRVRKRRTIPSILNQDETLQALTQSTVEKQKLIDVAKRKVEQAESQAQDLSKNIQ